MTNLASIVQTYEACLKTGVTSSFAIDALDRLGLPVQFATHRLPSNVKLDSYGCGITRNEARVGAAGELAEAVHSENHMTSCERVRASYNQMVNRYGARGVVDPIELSLRAGSEYFAEMPLTWVPAKRWPTHETVYLPLEAVASTPRQMQGVDPLYTPNSNGHGAGMCLEQALVHGLLELLQRDGNCTAFHALDQGLRLDIDVVRDESTRVLLKQFEDADIEVMVKLAATDFGLVNLYVVGRDHGAVASPLMLTACGEASHPDREFALRKALLEFAAARTRKAFMHGSLAAVERVTPPGYVNAALTNFPLASEEQRSLRAMAGWCGKGATGLNDLLGANAFGQRKQIPFSSIESASADSMRDPVMRMRLVGDRLLAAGHDIVYVDLSPTGSDVAVVKAMVTGLECETISDYRINERGVRRLLARGDDFIGIGKAPPGCLPVRLTTASQERLGSEIWLNPGRIDAIVGDLYPLYREPSRHAVQCYLSQN